MDAVGLAEGTKDIKSMPYQITQDAARWLGGLPTYRLAIMIGDSQQCRDLAWRIANEFARWWPAVWSDHSTGPWFRRQLVEAVAGLEAVLRRVAGSDQGRAAGAVAPFTDRRG